MINFLMRLPIKQIAAAIGIAQHAHDELTALSERRAALGTEEQTRQQTGEEGVTRREISLAAIDEKWREIVETAKADIEKQREAATDAINAQVDPDGHDITTGDGAADIALLQHNLIDNPDALARVLARHEGSTAFRIAGAKYAAAHNWPGFEGFTKEQSVRDYTNQIFTRLQSAAATPTGVDYSQYVGAAPTEYARIAAAYDLTAEFEASGGDKLAEIHD